MTSSHLLCPKCGALKPRADFKRILSRAQAKQVGYSGERRIQITSTMCKPCRPKRKPASKLTRKELINRIQGGDIHPVVGQAMLEQRQEQGKAKMSQAIRRAWNIARRATWATPMRELQEENRRWQSVREYRSRAGITPLYHFALTYVSMLGGIRSFMESAQRLQPDPATRQYQVPIAPHTDWQDYAGKEIMEYVQLAWARVPEQDRNKLKRLPALLTFTPEQRRAPPVPPTKPAKKGGPPPQQET